MTKPAIMDPPGNQIPSTTIHASGFPSPNVDHGQVNSKFMDDVMRMTYAVTRVFPVLCEGSSGTTGKSVCWAPIFIRPL